MRIQKFFAVAAGVLACSAISVFAQQDGGSGSVDDPQVPVINKEPVGPGGVTVVLPGNQEIDFTFDDVASGGYEIRGRQSGRIVGPNGHVTILCTNEVQYVCVTLVP